MHRDNNFAFLDSGEVENSNSEMAFLSWIIIRQSTTVNEYKLFPAISGFEYYSCNGVFAHRAPKLSLQVHERIRIIRNLTPVNKRSLPALILVEMVH